MQEHIEEATAAAGFEHYEVSAYARQGRRSRHNLNYWRFGDYLGIGAGAHSKLSFPHRIVRQVRLRQPASYLDGLRQRAFVAESFEVARADLPFEFMLNVLRLSEGFAPGDFCLAHRSVCQRDRGAPGRCRATRVGRPDARANHADASRATVSQRLAGAFPPSSARCFNLRRLPQNRAQGTMKVQYWHSRSHQRFEQAARLSP